MNEFYEKNSDTFFKIYVQTHHIGQDEHTFTSMHFHDSIEFAFVKKGSYRVYNNGEVRVIGEGEIAFVDSFIPHGYESVGEETIVYILLMDKKMLHDTEKYGLFEAFLHIDRDIFDKIIEYFDSFEAYASLNERTRVGFVNFIIGILNAHCRQSEIVKDKAQKTFVMILKYINLHFNEDLTLDSLAKEFFYTKNYFSSLFNRYAGMGLREYINRRRIAEVLKQRSLNDGRSLWSIARMCGFTNEKTFYRAYKQYKDESPI